MVCSGVEGLHRTAPFEYGFIPFEFLIKQYLVVLLQGKELLCINESEFAFFMQNHLKCHGLRLC